MDLTSGGVPEQEMNKLKAAMELVAGSAKPSADNLKALAVQLDKEAKESKKTTAEFSKLAQLLPKLTKESGAYASAVGFATAKIVEDQKLLTSEGQATHLENMKLVKEGMAASGDDSVKRAAWHAKGRELEKENMQARLENVVATGKATKGLGGIAMTVGAQVQKYGVGAAQFFGDAVGASGGLMAVMAGVFAAIAGVALAYQASARAARDAASAGQVLGDKTVGNWMRAMREANSVGGMGISIFPEEDVLKNLVSSTKEYAYDIGLTGQSYKTSATALEDVRAEMELGIPRAGHVATTSIQQFVVDAMKVGMTYGIQGDEAVKMATRIGVIGRGSRDEAVYSFAAMAEASQKTHTPMQALMSTFEGLGEATNGLNLSAETLTGQTLELHDAMREAASSSKYGVGIAGARGEQQARLVSDFIKNINNIDPKRLMALNQTPGGTFASALSRMVEQPAKTLVDGIKHAAQKMGVDFNYNEKDRPGSDLKAFKIAKALNLSGNERELTIAGKTIMAEMRNGTFDPEKLRSIQARISDDKFDQAKSVGQNLAQGTDIMHVIAGTMKNMLMVLVEFANRVTSLPMFTMGGSRTSYQLEQAQRAQGYGSSSGGGRTVNAT